MMLTTNNNTIILDAKHLLVGGYKKSNKASGVLFGMDATDPTDSLITDIGIKYHRCGVQNSIDYYPRDSSLGINVIPVLSHDWASENVGYPGDGGDWSVWNTYLDNKLNLLESSGTIPYAIDIWNEPDLANYWNAPMQQFYDAWNIATIKVHAKGWKAMGPSHSAFLPNLLIDFFNNINYIDVLAIHSMGVDDHLKWKSRIGQIRALANKFNNSNCPFVLSEYVGPNLQIGDPAELLNWIISIEQTRTDAACHSIYHEPMRLVDGLYTGYKRYLSGLLSPGAYTRSTWWVMKKYNDMSGRIISNTNYGTLAGAKENEIMVLICKPRKSSAPYIKLNILNSEYVFSSLNATLKIESMPHRYYGPIAEPILIKNKNINITNNMLIDLPVIHANTAYSIKLSGD